MRVTADSITDFTNKTLTSAVLAGAFTGTYTLGGTPTITAPIVTGIVTWSENTRQTFAPGATVSGFNVGQYAGVPSTLVTGDIWYDSKATFFRCSEDGVTRNLMTYERSGTVSNKTYASPIFSGTATGSWTIGGTPAAISDITWAGTGAVGPVIRSPDGAKWRLSVDNSGVLSATSVP